MTSANNQKAIPSPRAFFQNDRVLLFTLSFLSLLIEMTLIRHLSSEIRIFAYFKNLALIGAFLGLGFGYLYRPRLCVSITAVCVALIALAANPVTGFTKISQYLSVSDFNVWAQGGGGGGSFLYLDLGLLMLTILFFVIILSLAPVGQRLAEVFDRSENRILDYSINIAGSLLGVWFFAWLSFEYFPPAMWYMTSMGLILAMWRWNWKKSVLILTASVVAFASLIGATSGDGVQERWSPYQKIIFKKKDFSYTVNGEKKSIDYYSLKTNNTIYMYLFDLSYKLRRQHPAAFSKELDHYLYYDIPYNFPDRLDDVLVLGAGAGNDVAGALRAGAKSVTAVEIDPVIISFGKGYHPEKPYRSDRVTIVNNDARNFLRRTDKKFDLIILGLLDSHTLTSSFSNTNLDSFMYTLESIGDMKRRLKDDGVLALSFQLRFLWMGTKIYKMIEDRFGKPPVVIHYPSDKGFIRGTGGTYFIISPDDDIVMKKVKSDPTINAFASRSAKHQKFFAVNQAEPQTDDWPYFYVRSRTIPSIHLMVSVLLIGIFLFVYMYFFGKPGVSDLHFAALGAGFLLLEVAVISRFALFWGTTWIVSSIVISLILISILIANALFLWIKRPAPYPALYAVLAVTLVALYLTPLESDWVIILYLAPFTLIGYIFAQSFNSAKLVSRALAYNLFGALVGGFSESLSFVFGLSGLVLVAFCFYALSFAFARKPA